MTMPRPGMVIALTLVIALIMYASLLDLRSKPLIASEISGETIQTSGTENSAAELNTTTTNTTIAAEKDINTTTYNNTVTTVTVTVTNTTTTTFTYILRQTVTSTNVVTIGVGLTPEQAITVVVVVSAVCLVVGYFTGYRTAERRVSEILAHKAKESKLR